MTGKELCLKVFVWAGLSVERTGAVPWCLLWGAMGEASEARIPTGGCQASSSSSPSPSPAPAEVCCCLALVSRSHRGRTPTQTRLLLSKARAVFSSLPASRVGFSSSITSHHQNILQKLECGLYL